MATIMSKVNGQESMIKGQRSMVNNGQYQRSTVFMVNNGQYQRSTDLLIVEGQVVVFIHSQGQVHILGSNLQHNNINFHTVFRIRFILIRGSAPGNSGS